MQATLAETMESVTEALEVSLKTAAAQEQTIATAREELGVAVAQLDAVKLAAQEFVEELDARGYLAEDDVTKLASAASDTPGEAFGLALFTLESISSAPQGGSGIDKLAATTAVEDPWSLVKSDGA